MIFKEYLKKYNVYAFLYTHTHIYIYIYIYIYIHIHSTVQTNCYDVSYCKE